MKSDSTEKSAQIVAAEQALAQLDPLLGGLIAAQGSIVHVPRGDYFFSLARSIIGQQVSVAAATAIFGRLEVATALDPAVVVATTADQWRAIGVSRQKAGYLHDLAEHFVRDPQVFNHLDTLSDQDVIRELVAVKGVGVWTAQMFLMFTLVRLDVFAPDDAGLQRAIRLLYGWDSLPRRAELDQFAQRWQPYRSVASWHLWRSLDNEPAV